MAATLRQKIRSQASCQVEYEAKCALHQPTNARVRADPRGPEHRCPRPLANRADASATSYSPFRIEPMVQTSCGRYGEYTTGVRSPGLPFDYPHSSRKEKQMKASVLSVAIAAALLAVACSDRQSTTSSTTPPSSSSMSSTSPSSTSPSSPSSSSSMASSGQSSPSSSSPSSSTPSPSASNSDKSSSASANPPPASTSTPDKEKGKS